MEEIAKYIPIYVDLYTFEREFDLLRIDDVNPILFRIFARVLSANSFTATLSIRMIIR
jgi:hypothetical protein